MREVTTKEELAKALFGKDKDLHVANERLSAGLATMPKQFRLIRYMLLANGYRMILQQRMGTFDARFIKEENA